MASPLQTRDIVERTSLPKAAFAAVVRTGAGNLRGLHYSLARHTSGIAGR